MRQSSPRRRLLLVGLAIAVASGSAVTTQVIPASASRPTAIVAIGDSFAAGEGAGSYEPASDRPGNACHRSTTGQINQTAVPGVAARITIGCSGATTDNVRLGGVVRYGEAPQAEQLRTVARNYQVTSVVLTAVMNNIGFANLVIDCMRAYFLLGPRCQDSWQPKVTAALATAAPKLAQNIADIRTVMREAGYADSDYQLILQSYSSPFAADNRYSITKPFHGCAFRDDDARWARDVAVPQIAATISKAASDAGARFLDLGPTLFGREVCARGVSHSQEWANGVFFDLTQLRNGIGEHLVQQSAHPNARGYGQMARCLTAFHAMSAAKARCVRGADGNAGAVAVSAVTSVTPHTVPTIPEPAPAEEPIPGEA